jgi:hypothetical protein
LTSLKLLGENHMSLQKTYVGLLSLLAVASFGTAAQAQIFSNSSGYNASNAQGIHSGAMKTSTGKYSENVVSQAASLNQALAAAQQAVVDAEARAKDTTIDAYTRQPTDTKAAGANGENCPQDPAAVAELEKARTNLAQANQAASSFLQSVSSPTAELVQKTGECINCTKGW